LLRFDRLLKKQIQEKTVHRRNFIQATALTLALPSAELLAKGGAHIDAADYGFLPTESGVNNQAALQRAVDQGGSIVINLPGTYKLAGTVYLGDNTALDFGAGVIIQKVAEKGDFTHVFINKGALSWTWNSNISITGLHLQVNGVEKGDERPYGLRGQVAFFTPRTLRSSASAASTWEKDNSAYTFARLKIC
jgi:hypothetical protein